MSVFKLRELCERGDVAGVEAALAKGEDPNTRGTEAALLFGDPCTRGVDLGNIDQTEALARGEKTNARGLENVTPLMVATLGGHVGVVEALLLHPRTRVNDFISVADSDGSENMTALDLAFFLFKVNNHDFKIVRLLANHPDMGPAVLGHILAKSIRDGDKFSKSEAIVFGIIQKALTRKRKENVEKERKRLEEEKRKTEEEVEREKLDRQKQEKICKVGKGKGRNAGGEKT